MPGRDVTLTIKVKDNEVVEGEASLKRLKKAADDVGSSKSPSLGSGNTSVAEEQQKRLAAFMGKDLPEAAGKAEQAVGAVEEATAGASEAATGAAAGFGSLATGIGVVAGAFALVVAVAV